MTPRNRRVAAAAGVGAVAAAAVTWIAVANGGDDPDPAAAPGDTATTAPGDDGTGDPAPGGADPTAPATDGTPAPPAPGPTASAPRPAADATLDPITVEDEDEVGIDDDGARDVFCSIEPGTQLRGLVGGAGEDVDPDQLRDALVLLDDTRSQWAFASFGRPDFESFMTLVDDVADRWQEAMDGFDSQDADAAGQALGEADDIIDQLDVLVENADVDCD